MKAIVLAIVVLPALAIVWVLVQNAWRRSFQHDVSDEDVLASRLDCDGCSCIGICLRKQEGATSRQIIPTEKWNSFHKEESTTDAGGDQIGGNHG